MIADRKRCEPSGALLGQCVTFIRLLRRAGFAVTPAHAVDLARALDFVDIGARQDFRMAAQAILVRRPEERALFDELFDHFWRVREDSGKLPLRPTERHRILHGEGTLNPVSYEAQSPHATRVERPAAYSAAEVLRHKDFGALTDAERAAVHRLITRTHWRIAPRRSRRLVAKDAGILIDLRRTLHRSLRTGGEVLMIERRQRKPKQRPLVVLCDVSGSMQRYSRLLLPYFYALARQPRRVETFVFSTRLSRVTRELRGGVDAALNKAVSGVADWGGGTRIGETIRLFNRYWARRVLGQGAIVLLVSDGWERGDVTLLEQEIARLHRLAYRLVWLNPQLGAPGYQPLVRGMQAALPHIDDFLPVHNLASLEQLTGVLEEL